MKKKNISETHPDRGPDTEPLLEYLRDTVEKELEQIRNDAAVFEREREEALTRRITAFKKEEEKKAHEMITREEERLARTFQLEVRRIVSRAIEELFKETVEKAAGRAGAGEALAANISRLLADTAARDEEIIIMVAPGDEGLKKILQKPGAEKVEIVEDPSIRYGGAVIKKGKGPLLNLTIDRILFRKKETLRLEMMSLLREKGLLAELEEMYGSE